MSDPIKQILDGVLREEGGYQDHPEDSGNWYKGKNLGTNFGITPKVLAEYTGKEPTVKTMKNLTEQTARDIYRKKYVAPIVKNMNPPKEVLPQLVDMNINHGYGNTAVLYQRAAGAKVDGKIGPGTRQAASRLPVRALNNRLVDVRKKFYSDIIKNRPDQATFRNGWMDRAEHYRIPAPAMQGQQPQGTP